MIDIRRPLPPAAIVLAGLAVLVAGAAYCMGYSMLSGSTNDWARSLSWSAGAVLPWLAAFEWIKRRGLTARAPILLVLVATGLVSLGIELAIDRLVWAKPSSTVALQLLRRLPAIGVMVVLLALRNVGRTSGREADAVPLAATDLRFVRAADNYVELHFAGELLRLDRLVRGRGSGEWWVLDFKSAAQPERQPELLAQMARYREAVAAAYPGAAVRTAFLTAQGTLVPLG